jgi:hypothetical protein
MIQILGVRHALHSRCLIAQALLVVLQMLR